MNVYKILEDVDVGSRGVALGTLVLIEVGGGGGGEGYQQSIP